MSTATTARLSNKTNCTLRIDLNFQRHRAISLQQHGFLKWWWWWILHLICYCEIRWVLLLFSAKWSDMYKPIKQINRGISPKLIYQYCPLEKVIYRTIIYRRFNGNKSIVGIANNWQLWSLKGTDGVIRSGVEPVANDSQLIVFSLACCYFYRAMHFSANARSWDRMSSVCPSVCPSVTLVICDHIDWKSWKVIARSISPTPSLFAAQRRST